jgi:hypothetical protein
MPAAADAPRPDVTCAPGTVATARAQVARYAAHQPLTAAIAAAAAGASAASATVANASHSKGGTTGATSRFAGIARSGIVWNCNHTIGAVATPHAVEIAIVSATNLGTGQPSSARTIAGASVIAATAVNDS